MPTQVATKPTELSPEMERVKRFVSKRYKVSAWRCDRFWRLLNRPGKSSASIRCSSWAIAVESSFNPFAESGVGAQG